jgi:hypothetical protein
MPQVVANGATSVARSSEIRAAWSYSSSSTTFSYFVFHDCQQRSGFDYQIDAAEPLLVNLEFHIRFRSVALRQSAAIDTRNHNGQPFSGTLIPPVNVVGSPCAPPSTATAYVFNATVVPDHRLGYLTLWPDGEQQPVVSTLNAYDGFVTSNMAIVPNMDGSTDAYAGDGSTQLILDISGYFAP